MQMRWQKPKPEKWYNKSKSNMQKCNEKNYYRVTRIKLVILIVIMNSEINS